MSTKNVNRIKAVYDLATPQELTVGRAWYPQAYEIARIMASDYGLCGKACTLSEIKLSYHNS